MMNQRHDWQYGPSYLSAAPEPPVFDDRKSSYSYTLEVVQQPVQARAMGWGIKCDSRRPVDPPPVVYFTISDAHGKPVTHEIPSNFILHTTLHEVISNDGGVRTSIASRRLTGSTLASLSHIRLPAPGKFFFILHDISIRQEGKYQLEFNVWEVVPGKSYLTHRGREMSNVIVVYSPKAFPGLGTSSNLIKEMASQGCKVRVRKASMTRRRKMRPDGTLAKASVSSLPSQFRGHVEDVIRSGAVVPPLTALKYSQPGHPRYTFTAGGAPLSMPTGYAGGESEHGQLVTAQQYATRSGGSALAVSRSPQNVYYANVSDQHPGSSNLPPLVSSGGPYVKSEYMDYQAVLPGQQGEGQHVQSGSTSNVGQFYARVGSGDGGAYPAHQVYPNAWQAHHPPGAQQSFHQTDYQRPVMYQQQGVSVQTPRNASYQGEQYGVEQYSTSQMPNQAALLSMVFNPNEPGAYPVSSQGATQLY